MSFETAFQLQFWMGHIPLALVAADASKGHIDFIDFQLFSKVFVSPKPNQFQGAGLVLKDTDQTLAPFHGHLFQLHQSANNLYVGPAIAQLIDLVKAAAVDVAKRIALQGFPGRGQAQF